MHSTKAPAPSNDRPPRRGQGLAVLPWFGTVRGQVSVAFLAMTVITGGLGGYAALGLKGSSTLVARTFDESLQSINHARAAATDFASMQTALARRLTVEPEGRQRFDEAIDTLGQSLADDLSIAAERSQSARAKRAAAEVERAVEAWQQARRRLLAGEDPGLAWAEVERHANTVEQQVDLLVNYTAGDGFSYRQSAREAIGQAERINLAATAGAMLVSGLVAWLLARRIMGPLAAASTAAERIAAGELDHVMPQGGADELGALLAAMGVMRDNIRAMVEGEVAQRRSAEGRLAEALDNMTHGLCFYDAENRLQVVNRRFCEIFGLATGRAAVGLTLREVIALKVQAGNFSGQSTDDVLCRRKAIIDARVAATYVQDLSNGRAVAISHQPTADGGWIATYEDITERRQAEAQVLFLARHDALTGLPNRVLFNERIEHELAQAGRGNGFAVLCLDLDLFKGVNDTLGHPVGDELLRQVAERLHACVREVDTVARLGGDEFAIIQQRIERAEDVAVLAARIVEVVSAPYDLDGHLVTIGVSIGISLAPGDGTSSNKLLKNADMALYRAKEDGRGTWRFFQPEMDARLQARRALEVDLREALARDEFELHYQPIYDLKRDRIGGFEALLRWRHPERGMVSPGDFIPLAEEIGLITGLGDWVLHQACAEASRWPDHVKVSVNVSPAQFKTGRLLRTVTEALRSSGLGPQRLDLEITESVLLSSTSATLALLQGLHERGARISLDDFGTGYSSLSYLRNFPFDRIKIDRSFIRGLGTDKGSGAIVRATIGLAGDLGIIVTAEGVETAEQLQRLRLEGCDEVQGYYFSRPVPARSIPDLLERWSPGAQKVA